MFTMLDLAAAKSNVYHKRGGSQLYTPSQNELSFDLAQLSSVDRGTVVEVMVVDRMGKFGIDASHVGGSNCANDIDLYVGGKIVRGEVKSSLLGPKSRKYYFQGVKPEAFDMIFFAFVNPWDGLVVKTASSKDIARWVSEYNPKRKAEGYDIYFREDMTNGKIPTIVWGETGEEVTT